MGNIVLLDDLTINKIAAGEVIERPASVIKEMVENSIDAGAKNITVEIKNGGIEFIKITDDGKGIARDDLEIAFERHATSKIRAAEDLDSVISMGFRGEALASIAAISNVELISKPKDQDIGYRIVMQGGDLIDMGESAPRNGTSITVKNLFFNTPVRYKFLKKDYTESGYIEDVITRLSLVNPDISFKLINSGKIIIQTNGSGDIKDIVYSIFGKEIANAINIVDYKTDDMEVTGVVGRPEIARSNRSKQIFFVNKRYVKDKTLIGATEQAYKGLIPIGKYGFAILNLKMQPQKVDVNVHPAKLEVRFAEESKVFQIIYHAVKESLLGSQLVANSAIKNSSLNEEENLKNNEIEKGRTRGLTFEERLQILRNSKKEDTGKIQTGLFQSRKNSDERMNEYVSRESQIKTNVSVDEDLNQNNILADIIKQKEIKNVEDLNFSNSNLNVSLNNIGDNEKEKIITGGPINTQDILEQLKALKIKTQDDKIEVNNLKEEEEKYNLEDSKIDIKEDNIKDNIENNEQDKETIKLQTIEENNTEIKEEIVADDNVEKDNTKEFDILKEIEKSNLEIASIASKNIDEIKSKINSLEKNEETVSEDFEEMYIKLFGNKPVSIIENEKDKQRKDFDLFKSNLSIFDDEEVKKKNYKIIGIVFDTYIILEIDNEMYILDQHAAHERIIYERVKENYYSDEIKDSQMLLLPDIITLTHKEMNIARENMQMFNKAGFMVEDFGENTIKLSGVPSICVELNTQELFLETLDEINTVARTAKQEKEEKFIATVACKAAVKGNMSLEIKEVESLLDELLVLVNPFTCPHGRPTTIKMSKYDIERKFARK